MALPIEGFTIVARLEAVASLLGSGAIDVPNATSLQDEHLWRCSFMNEQEARSLLAALGRAGLEVERGPEPDAVLVDEYEQQVEPYCEWLSIGRWDRAVIGWLAGTRPEKVVAREGWDPAVGSGLTRASKEELLRDYRLERTENGIETYVHRETGEKIYASHAPSPGERFEKATDIVVRRGLDVPPPPLDEEGEREVTGAEAELAALVDEHPQWWQARFFLGKARQQLGRLDAARDTLRAAAEASEGDPGCLRELAGACLLTADFDEAVEAATRAIVAQPDNAELIANQAACFLLAGRIPEAETSIDAAVRMAPDDEVNRNIEEIVRRVASGERPRPRTLEEMMTPDEPDPPRGRPWWKLW